MKKTSTFQNSLIWFGAGVSLAEILTGTSFAPLGMAKGFAAILIGHIIGCAMMLLAGLIGGRTGRSAMETVKMSFGQRSPWSRRAAEKRFLLSPIPIPLLCMEFWMAIW